MSDQLLKERLDHLLRGPSSTNPILRDGMLDTLVTKYRPFINPDDDVPTIDEKIKRNFTNIKDSIVADLNDKRTELDELLADKDKMDKFVQDTLANLKKSSESNPNQLVSADDLLEDVDTESILNPDESTRFCQIIREEFGKEADVYWDKQVGSCLSIIKNLESSPQNLTN